MGPRNEKVLAVLAGGESAGLSVSQVAERSGLGESGAWHTLRDLREFGLVDRSSRLRKPGGRWCYYYHLTTAGREALADRGHKTETPPPLTLQPPTSQERGAEAIGRAWAARERAAAAVQAAERALHDAKQRHSEAAAQFARLAGLSPPAPHGSAKAAS